MVAWSELLTSDIGLLSLFTILFMVVMAVYIYRFAVSRMHDEDAGLAPRSGKPSHGA